MSARYQRGRGRGPIWARRSEPRAPGPRVSPSQAIAAATTTTRVIAVLRSRALPLEHRADLMASLVEDFNNGNDRAGAALVDEMLATIMEVAKHCSGVYGGELDEYVQAGRRAVISAARMKAEATDGRVVLKVLKREICRVVRKSARRYLAFRSRTEAMSTAAGRLMASRPDLDAGDGIEAIDLVSALETPASFSGTPESAAAARQSLASLSAEEVELLVSVLVKDEPVVSWVRRHRTGLGSRALRREVAATVQRLNHLVARLRQGCFR